MKPFAGAWIRFTSTESKLPCLGIVLAGSNKTPVIVAPLDLEGIAKSTGISRAKHRAEFQGVDGNRKTVEFGDGESALIKLKGANEVFIPTNFSIAISNIKAISLKPVE